MTVTSNSTLFESAVKGEVNADGYTLYNFPAKNGGVIDESFLLANVTLTYAKGVDCTLLMSFEGTNITITQEQEQTQEPQPNTGVSLPVVVLIGGAACAVLLYSITNKNKKMYKI